MSTPGRGVFTVGRVGGRVGGGGDDYGMDFGENERFKKGKEKKKANRKDGKGVKN